MEIEKLNRLHWLAISIVVGIALAFVWRDPNTASSLFNDSSREMGIQDFTRLLSTLDLRGQPILTNLVVHPPMPTAVGTVTRVTGFKAAMIPPGSFLFAGPAGRADEMTIGDFNVMAPVPFVATGFFAKHTFPNVTEYLKWRQQSDPRIQFRPGYESIPAVRMAIAIILSIVVIGGVWPTVVGLMTGQGPWLMPKRGSKSVLASPYSYPETPAATVDPRLKADALRQVGQMNEMLEGGLAGSIAMTSANPGAPSSAAAPMPGVKQLAGTSDPAAAIPIKPEDPKEFRGEFYPVAKPGHHEEVKE